jgi:hypothetical protein
VGGKKRRGKEEIKGESKKNLTKRVQVIGSSKFWCLPPIIPPLLWGIDTRILKI